jgi:hypothetical protein
MIGREATNLNLLTPVIASCGPLQHAPYIIDFVIDNYRCCSSTRILSPFLALREDTSGCRVRWKPFSGQLDLLS